MYREEHDRFIICLKNRMRLRSFHITAILLFFCFVHSKSFGQEWSSPIQPGGVEQLNFRWRNYIEDQKTTGITEWFFLNKSDSLIEFTYLILSNKNDELLGHITLLPHKRTLSGFLMRGDSITSVQVDEVVFRQSTTKTSAQKN